MTKNLTTEFDDDGAGIDEKTDCPRFFGEGSSKVDLHNLGYVANPETGGKKLRTLIWGRDGLTAKLICPHKDSECEKRKADSPNSTKAFKGNMLALNTALMA